MSAKEMSPEEAHYWQRQRAIAQAVLSWVADGEYDDLSPSQRKAQVRKALNTVEAVSKQFGEWPDFEGGTMA